MTDFVSVDIEADGPIPGRFSMLALGAVLVRNPAVKFYVEFRPMTEEFEQEALEVCKKGGLDREYLKTNGSHPAAGMRGFSAWLDKFCKGKPKMVAYPIAFDWQFVNYYFINYMGRNPFGINGMDIRSLYYGLFPSEDGFAVKKSDMKTKLQVSEFPHTHNALDDALEQAMIFKRLLEIRNGPQNS